MLFRSGDVLTALLLICDSDGSAVREHPETGARIHPAPGFQIIATTNAERLSDLPQNLVDRFPVRININTVNPDALTALPAHLRGVAKNYAERSKNRYSLRSFFAYDKLAQHAEVDDKKALRLVFGNEATAIGEALTVARMSLMSERAPESAVSRGTLADRELIQLDEDEA